MDDLKIIQRVAARFLQAGPVVDLPRKPKVPTITIAGKKYNLSDYIGPMGSDIEESAKQGPARMIVNPHANKWRYLWVYDLDKSTVIMWRASDGDEKFWGSANSNADVIARLDKKGQINRVSNSEFRRVEADMKRRYQETMAALERSVAESKDELTKQVDKLVEEFFESHVAPKLERAISSVERGATPLGFELNERIPSLSRAPDALLRVLPNDEEGDDSRGGREVLTVKGC